MNNTKSMSSVPGGQTDGHQDNQDLGLGFCEFIFQGIICLLPCEK